MNQRSAHDGLRVAFWPRWPENPYLADLRAGLEDEGAAPCDASVRTLLRGADVFHLQWPDAIWSGSRRGRLARLVDVAALLALTAVRRMPVVVTVHNLANHESSGRFARGVVAAVLRRARRVIVLSESGRRRFVESAGEQLDRDTVDVIAHMDWRERYPPVSVVEARRTLVEVPPGDGPLIGWFGLIRPYKGVERLTEIVATDTSPRPLRLLLLGRHHDTVSDREPVRLDSASDRVLHVDRHVTDEEISALCALSDFVVFPFERVENSGSVIAALAAGARVVAPRRGGLVDLEAHPRLHLYDGAFSRSTLENISSHPSSAFGGAEICSVGEVARRHLGVYSVVTT